MLKFLKAGFYTSVQDTGRFNYRHKGVPVSGVMDTHTVAILNTLLENTQDAAVLEITMTGPTIEFLEDTYIALGGAVLTISLNGKALQNYSIYKVVSGDKLSYGKLKKGFRAYLAVKDGFTAPLVLESRSYYRPLTPKNRLEEQDTITYNSISSFLPKISKLKVTTFLDKNSLELYKGPEYDMLDKQQQTALFTKVFTIANENNRMAYQLNETISGHAISMLTSATMPGTVQLTSSGKLIVLMKDGQTTGGYPRILQLSNKAMAILAQKKSRDTISFTLIS